MRERPFDWRVDGAPEGKRIIDKEVKKALMAIAAFIVIAAVLTVEVLAQVM